MKAETFRRLRQTLQECGPFESNERARAIFRDPRLSSWYEQVRDASSPAARVEAVIDLLADRSRADGTPGLILLLEVLRDRIPQEDNCHVQLESLLRVIRYETGMQVSDEIRSSRSQTDQPTPPSAQPQSKAEGGRPVRVSGWRLFALLIGLLALLAPIWIFFRDDDPLPTPTTESFVYLVRVQNVIDGSNLANAHVIIELTGEPPLDEYTSSSGIARLFISVDQVNTPARLIVVAEGYIPYREELNLRQDQLPETVRLSPEDDSISVTSSENKTATATGPSSTPPVVATSNGAAETNAAEPEATEISPVPPTATSIMLSPSSGEVRSFSLPTDYSVEMLYIPAGEFIMGSESGEENETPIHEIYLDSFWIDRVEVTNDQFRAFVEDEGYETTAEEVGNGYIYNSSTDTFELVDDVNWRHPNDYRSSLVGLGDHPVVLVSWVDAQQFCHWRGARLPTEAEWAKAARGNDGRIYPWGDNFNASLVNSGRIDDGFARTAPTGSYPDGASPFGVYDMAGNALEWVSDWYDADYYLDTPRQNPPGPDTGEARVMRGGSWISGPHDLRIARRTGNNPANRYNNVGFRCVTSAFSPSVTPTASTTPTPFFSEEFEGESINGEWWSVVDSGSEVRDGVLQIDITNEEQELKMQRIRPELHGRRFQTIEYAVTLLEVTEQGWLSVNTSCTEEQNNLFVEIGKDGPSIRGLPKTLDEPDEHLLWEAPLSVGQQYVIRLVQDGDMVRAYLDGEELSPPLPCAEIGNILYLGGGTKKEYAIRGYFDYVRLWEEPFLP